MNMINFITELPVMRHPDESEVNESRNNELLHKYTTFFKAYIFVWKHVTKYVIYDWQLHKDASYVH